jgi:hypothetical protein
VSLNFLDEPANSWVVGVSLTALNMPIKDTKMDWNTLYCPDKCCRYYGIPFQPGKMVKNGSSYGQPLALCRGCGSSVSLS